VRPARTPQRSLLDQLAVRAPVVVPLFTTAIPTTVFAISGTAKNADPAVTSEIQRDPGGFYANLHSAEFPGGAVRGQLFG
jgi:hypothetical protein